MRLDQNLGYHVDLTEGQTTPEKLERGAIGRSGQQIRIDLDEDDAIDLE